MYILTRGNAHGNKFFLGYYLELRLNGFGLVVFLCRLMFCCLEGIYHTFFWYPNKINTFCSSSFVPFYFS